MLTTMDNCQFFSWEAAEMGKKKAPVCRSAKESRRKKLQAKVPMPCWLKKPARFTRKLLQTLKVANLTRSKGGVTALEHASQKKLDQKKVGP